MKTVMLWRGTPVNTCHHAETVFVKLCNHKKWGIASAARHVQTVAAPGQESLNPTCWSWSKRVVIVKLPGQYWFWQFGWNLITNQGFLPLIFLVFVIHFPFCAEEHAEHPRDTQLEFYNL